MDALILLVTTSIVSFILYHWFAHLADKDRQKRLDRLQKWIDEGGLDDAMDGKWLG
jgi:uncharacterized membrane protein YdjX (TVP38/TMEM64 family)